MAAVEPILFTHLLYLYFIKADKGIGDAAGSQSAGAAKSVARATLGLRALSAQPVESVSCFIPKKLSFGRRAETPQSRQSTYTRL